MDFDEIDALFAADFGDERPETLEQYVRRRLEEGVSGETLFGLAQVLKLQEERHSIFLGSDSFGGPEDGKLKREWVTKKKQEKWKGKDFTEICPMDEKGNVIWPEETMYLVAAKKVERTVVESKATQVETEWSNKECQTPVPELGVAQIQTEEVATRNCLVQASEQVKNQGSQTIIPENQGPLSSPGITMSLPGTRIPSPLGSERKSDESSTLFRPREFAAEDVCKRKRSISGRPKDSRSVEGTVPDSVPPPPPPPRPIQTELRDTPMGKGEGNRDDRSGGVKTSFIDHASDEYGWS